MVCSPDALPLPLLILLILLILLFCSHKDRVHVPFSARQIDAAYRKGEKLSIERTCINVTTPFLQSVKCGVVGVCSLSWNNACEKGTNKTSARSCAVFQQSDNSLTSEATLAYAASPGTMPVM